jgi:hypothetical protein
VIRAIAALFALAGLLAAAPAPLALDSQVVLQRYELEIGDLATPKASIFVYTISQLGPTNIEQVHRVYRSGEDVRDETLAVDGTTLTRKVVRISKRPDRYAVDRLAPRTTTYELIFLRSVKRGSHLDYEYEATPLSTSGPFTIERVTIDGAHFLPSVIRFHTAAGTAHGTGELHYAAFGPYWMPVSASINASVNGKSARERISWSGYRFPETLPPSTFAPRKTLHPTLPPN